MPSNNKLLQTFKNNCSAQSFFIFWSRKKKAGSWSLWDGPSIFRTHGGDWLTKEWVTWVRTMARSRGLLRTSTSCSWPSYLLVPSASEGYNMPVLYHPSSRNSGCWWVAHGLYSQQTVLYWCFPIKISRVFVYLNGDNKHSMTKYNLFFCSIYQKKKM